jgi:hypothetical protein
MDTSLTEIAISLTGLFLGICFLRRQRRDSLRCDIRNVRDNLFEFMRTNGRSMDDPGYQATRNMLKGVLVLTNHLSILSFFGNIYWYAKFKKNGYKFKSPFDLAQDGEVRKTLLDAHEYIQARILHYLFLEGTIGLFIRGIARMLSVLRIFGKIRDWATLQSGQFLAEAAMARTLHNHAGANW